MNWYLRKDDGVMFGPVPETALRQWAADGRIGPDDALSQDQAVWTQAPDVPVLGMDWMVELDDGSRYGPIHLLALRELMEDGSISGHTTVTHKATGEARTLGDALHDARVAEPPPAAAPPPRVAAEPVPSPRPLGRQEWKEIAESKDSFEREAGKWKRMYEDEHQSGLRREAALNERIEELRKSEMSARMRIEQLERKLAQIEKSYQLLKQTAEAGAGDDPSAQIALMESYQELSERYDSLMQQLTAKTGEIQMLLESRAQTEKDAEDRAKRMEEIVRRERTEADNARKRAAEMEETHLQLVKVYRDLNDRFIRMRGKESGTPPPVAAPPPDHRGRPHRHHGR